jgi:chemotaxis family two-component system sensor kinase Cph1
MINDDTFTSVDSKAVEDQVREATTELEQLKKDLIQVSYKLKCSQEEFEQFVYVASHDLQAPLRVVSGYLQLLEKKCSEKLDLQSKEFMNCAKDGIKKMDEFISSLLMYSLVDKKKKMLADVDTSIACEQALVNLRQVIKEHQPVIIMGRLPIIHVDANHMVQLFQNLIAQAIKFRRSTLLQIEIKAHVVNQDWLFTIKNNGIGIDQEYGDKIFNIAGAPSSIYPETGMSLGICKKIVEIYEGRIWLESEYSFGSTFHFTLPMVRS